MQEKDSDLEILGCLNVDYHQAHGVLLWGTTADETNYGRLTRPRNADPLQNTHSCMMSLSLLSSHYHLPVAVSPFESPLISTAILWQITSVISSIPLHKSLPLAFQHPESHFICHEHQKS